MIKKIKISSNNYSYLVNIESNSLISNLKKIISKNKKLIFLIDKKVFYIFKKLNNFKQLNYIVIDCSEKIKSFDMYENISERILNIGIDRSFTIVAIGGGTLGDLSGFVASTLLRGINLILVPTTLLSQVDSSIGGKNGINTKYGKNLVGTFYQPKLVIIDPSVLSSLSKREILSGYAEIVKHAIIKDKKFFEWLDKNSKKLFNLDNKAISQAIYKSILIKKEYIIKDEKEKLKNKNSRAILNFGHTFGHALEKYHNYNKELTHGEAISIGMIIAANISYKLNYLSFINLRKIKDHFKANKLPLSNKKMYNKKIFEIIRKDKKNFGDKVNLVLLNNIGSAFLSDKLSLDNIKKITK